MLGLARGRNLACDCFGFRRQLVQTEVLFQEPQAVACRPLGDPAEHFFDIMGDQLGGALAR